MSQPTSLSSKRSLFQPSTTQDFSPQGKGTGAIAKDSSNPNKANPKDVVVKSDEASSLVEDSKGTGRPQGSRLQFLADGLGIDLDGLKKAVTSLHTAEELTAAIVELKSAAEEAEGESLRDINGALGTLEAYAEVIEEVGKNQLPEEITSPIKTTLASAALSGNENLEIQALGQLAQLNQYQGLLEKRDQLSKFFDEAYPRKNRQGTRYQIDLESDVFVQALEATSPEVKALVKETLADTTNPTAAKNFSEVTAYVERLERLYASEELAGFIREYQELKVKSIEDNPNAFRRQTLMGGIDHLVGYEDQLDALWNLKEGLFNGALAGNAELSKSGIAYRDYLLARQNEIRGELEDQFYQAEADRDAELAENYDYDMEFGDGEYDDGMGEAKWSDTPEMEESRGALNGFNALIEELEAIDFSEGADLAQNYEELFNVMADLEGYESQWVEGQIDEKVSQVTRVNPGHPKAKELQALYDSIQEMEAPSRQDYAGLLAKVDEAALWVLVEGRVQEYLAMMDDTRLTDALVNVGGDFVEGGLGKVIAKHHLGWETAGQSALGTIQDQNLEGTSQYEAQYTRYSKVQHLLNMGKTAEARALFIELEGSPEHQNLVENHQDAARFNQCTIAAAIVIASAATAGLATEFIGGYAAAAGLTGRGLSLLKFGTNAVTFTVAHRRLDTWVQGETFFDSKLSAGRNALLLGEEIALNAGMFAFLGKSQKLFMGLINRRLAPIAYARLAKMPVRPGSAMSKEFHTAFQKEMQALHKTWYVELPTKLGSFATELGAFGAWDFVQMNYQLAKHGQFNPGQAFQQSILSPQAWEDRAIFLIALKAGGALVAPITKPMQEQARSFAMEKYKGRLETLEQNTQEAVRALEDFMAGDRSTRDPQELVKTYERALRDKLNFMDQIPELYDPQSYAIAEHMLKETQRFQSEYQKFSQLFGEKNQYGITTQGKSGEYNQAKQAELIKALEKNKIKHKVRENGLMELEVTDPFTGQVTKLRLSPVLDVKSEQGNEAEKDSPPPSPALVLRDIRSKAEGAKPEQAEYEVRWAPSGLMVHPSEGTDLLQVAREVTQTQGEIPNHRVVINAQAWSSKAVVPENLRGDLQRLADGSGQSIALKINTQPYALEFLPQAEQERQEKMGSMAAAGAEDNNSKANPVLTEILEGLTSEDPDERRKTYSGLGLKALELDSEDQLLLAEKMEALLSDSDPLVRGIAPQAIKVVVMVMPRPHQITQAYRIVSLLKHPKPEVRLAALATLNRILPRIEGDIPEEIIFSVDNCLEDEVPGVQEDAEDLIIKLIRGASPSLVVKLAVRDQFRSLGEEVSQLDYQPRYIEALIKNLPQGERLGVLAELAKSFGILNLPFGVIYSALRRVSPQDVIEFAKGSNPSPLLQHYPKGFSDLSLEADYPSMVLPWQNQIRFTLREVDLDEVERVRLSLAQINPFHYLDHEAEEEDFLDTVNQIREKFILNLLALGWKPGELPSPEQLESVLKDNEENKHLPLVSVGGEKGMFLLLNGHHRISALITLVAEGYLPEETLQNIPVEKALKVRPNVVLEESFEGELPTGMEGFHWQEVLKFNPKSVGLLNRIGVTGSLTKNFIWSPKPAEADPQKNYEDLVIPGTREAFWSHANLVLASEPIAGYTPWELAGYENDGLILKLIQREGDRVSDVEYFRPADSKLDQFPIGTKFYLLPSVSGGHDGPKDLKKREEGDPVVETFALQPYVKAATGVVDRLLSGVTDLYMEGDGPVEKMIRQGLSYLMFLFSRSPNIKNVSQKYIINPDQQVVEYELIKIRHRRGIHNPLGTLSSDYLKQVQIMAEQEGIAPMVYFIRTHPDILAQDAESMLDLTTFSPHQQIKMIHTTRWAPGTRRLRDLLNQERLFAHLPEKTQLELLEAVSEMGLSNIFPRIQGIAQDPSLPPQVRLRAVHVWNQLGEDTDTKARAEAMEAVFESINTDEEYNRFEFMAHLEMARFYPDMDKLEEYLLEAINAGTLADFIPKLLQWYQKVEGAIIDKQKSDLYSCLAGILKQFGISSENQIRLAGMMVKMNMGESVIPLLRAVFTENKKEPNRVPDLEKVLAAMYLGMAGEKEPGLEYLNVVTQLGQFDPRAKGKWTLAIAEAYASLGVEGKAERYARHVLKESSDLAFKAAKLLDDINPGWDDHWRRPGDGGGVYRSNLPQLPSAELQEAVTDQTQEDDFIQEILEHGILPGSINQQGMSLVSISKMDSNLDIWKLVKIDGDKMILERVPPLPGGRPIVETFRPAGGLADLFELGTQFYLLPGVSGGHDGPQEVAKQSYKILQVDLKSIDPKVREKTYDHLQAKAAEMTSDQLLDLALDVEESLPKVGPEEVFRIQELLIHLSSLMPQDHQVILAAMLANRLVSIPWHKETPQPVEAIFDFLEKVLPQLPVEARSSLWIKLEDFSEDKGPEIRNYVMVKLKELSMPWFYARGIFQLLTDPVEMLREAALTEGLRPIDSLSSKEILEWAWEVDRRLSAYPRINSDQVFQFIGKLFERMGPEERKGYFSRVAARMENEATAPLGKKILTHLNPYLQDEDHIRQCEEWLKDPPRHK